ncbi:MAG: hypothetical protein M3272_01655 [Actinomycetota bacterium]|nr:hypothetical protein [Actinomycetota bacterium]
MPFLLAFVLCVQAVGYEHVAGAVPNHQGRLHLPLCLHALKFVGVTGSPVRPLAVVSDKPEVRRTATGSRPSMKRTGSEVGIIGPIKHPWASIFRRYITFIQTMEKRLMLWSVEDKAMGRV